MKKESSGRCWKQHAKRKVMRQRPTRVTLQRHGGLRLMLTHECTPHGRGSGALRNVDCHRMADGTRICRAECHERWVGGGVCGFVGLRVCGFTGWERELRVGYGSYLLYLVKRMRLERITNAFRSFVFFQSGHKKHFPSLEPIKP